MRLLLIGDVHLRSTRPAMRKDDFVETQFAKMREIADIFRREHCFAALCTGDLFDRHDPTISLLNRCYDLFDVYEGRFYLPPGNHDLYGSSMTQLENSALYNLVKTGRVTLLDEKGSWEADTDIKRFGNNVHIWGTSYFHEKPLQPLDQEDLYLHGVFKILVAHHMVLEDKLWVEQPEDSFDLPQDFVAKHPGFQLILTGHYHYRVDTKVGDTEVINPGAVVRIKASKGDMALQPSVVVYDTCTREKLWIPLSSAKPVDEVFRPKEEAVDQDNPELEAFVQAVMASSADAGSLDKIVSMVLKQSSCSEEVAKLVREKIAEAGGAGG